MKKYEDWLEEFQETIIKWERDFYLTREFAVNRCVELIKTLDFVPYLYKRKLKKDLIEWGKKDEKNN